MTITLDELFSTGTGEADAARGAARLEQYHTMLKAAYAETASGNVALASPDSKILVKGLGRQRKALERLETIEKAWGASAPTDGGADFGA